MIVGEPWFSHWNHVLLEKLFYWIPQSQAADDRFDDLISNPFLGTWIFAAFFYWFWSIDDERKEQRRLSLFKTLTAICIAFVVTLAIRPLVSWPAPALNPRFQSLFPVNLWGQGTWNCFPSHSTLVYFMVALGFWPLNRGLSVALSLLALAVVSLPRVFLGGHYPVDIAFSCVLGFLTLIAVWKWREPPMIEHWLGRRGRGTAVRDWLLFVWVFELGEGFRGTEFLVAALRGLARHP